jgi:hypothetical protein
MEHFKNDKNNIIYSLGKEFVFAFDIIQDTNFLYLNKNEIDEFILAKNSLDTNNISEIYLNVIKARFLKRTNKNQTEIIYRFAPKPKFTASTGVVENDKNVWLHPPRNGFFKSLETCPFPYIKKGLENEKKWQDSMSIGNHWSNVVWGEWEGRLLLKYEYEIIGSVLINSDLGQINCIKIVAKANSRIGTSYLTSYYSDVFGFVRLEYVLFNGLKINLKLVKVSSGPIYRNAQSLFEK